MTVWLCKTCFNEVAPSAEPPETCRICSDERQYVPPAGQEWISIADFAATHRNDLRDQEPGLLGIGVEPQAGIGQRALLIEHPDGGVLWDGVPLLSEEAIDGINRRGGVRAMAMSHPHLYGAAVSNSISLGNVPIFIPAADRDWIARPHENIRVFAGDRLDLGHGVTAHVTGGHFDGSAFLHWRDGADGKGALLTGDTIMVTPGGGRVSFMWSVPGLIQLPPAHIRRIVAMTEPLAYDRIYGGWWDSKVENDAKAVVARSERRIREILGAPPLALATT